MEMMYYAHNNLGRAYDNQGNVDEAIKEYEKAVELDANDVYARNNLGRALCKERQN